MRILLISNYFPPETEGGLEWSAYEAAMGLHARGHHIEVLTTQPKDQPIAEEVAPFPVHRLLRYSFPAQYYGHRLRTVPRRIHDALEGAKVGKANLAIAKGFASKHAFDVVTTWGFSGISCAVTLPFSTAGMPIVWHVGDLNLREKLYPHRFNRVLHGLTDPRWSRIERCVKRDHVLANSQFTRRLYLRRGFKPEQVSVIYRGVSEDLLSQPPAEKAKPPVILMACRVTVQKGVEVAVRAMPFIEEAELHIAGLGEPEYLEHLKRLIHQTGVENRVKLLGFQPRWEVLRHMQEASIVLSGSLIEEYFGRVNIEAMACRTPLLASNTENVREIGVNGEHLLVYRQHDPEDLAEKANKILLNPSLVDDLVRQAYQHVRTKFSQEHIAQQIETYLLGAVKGNE